MKIFEFNSIQDVVMAYIEEQKVLGSKVTYQELAISMRIQKSYLSKVMKKDAHLSKDQVYLLAMELSLSEEEREFLFLLADRDKVAIKKLYQELNKKIKTIQNINTKSEDYLDKDSNTLSTSDIQKYYLNAENQLIHLTLGIKTYQSNVELLKSIFNLSDEQLSKSLNLLNELGLIVIKDKKIELIKSNLHLTKDSPFFEAWQTMLTLKSQEHIKKLSNDNKYNFIVTFSADEADHEKIRIEFMNYLKKVETIVKKSDPKDLYQMSYNLFKWT